jgi:hypothetical protein
MFRLWLTAWRSAPGCFRSSETTRPWVSVQTSWFRWQPSRVSPFGALREEISRGWVKVKKGDLTEGMTLLRSDPSAGREGRQAASGQGIHSRSAIP